MRRLWTVLAIFLLIAGIGLVFSTRSVITPTMSLDGPLVKYAEGTVETEVGTSTVGGERLPDSAGGLHQAITAYQGLRVGVEYNNLTAIVVSPIENEWEALASTVRGIELSPREHLPLERQAIDAATFPDSSLIQSLDLAVVDLDRRYKELAVTPATERPGALGDLVGALKRVVNLGVRTANVASDAAQQEAAIDLAKAGREEYLTGTLQNYEGASERPARFYRSIVQQLDATVGVRVGNQLTGTAFVITTNWAVTAGHVVAKVSDFRNVKIVFGHEEGDGGVAVPGTPCDVQQPILADSADGMDLAAFQFSCAGGKLPAGARPLALSSRPADIDEAVYVVGHPRKGTKHVADNAFIRYPHRLSLSGLSVVRDRIRDSGERQALQAGYSQCEPGWWCYRSAPARWEAGIDQQLIWPTVGFAANTYKGNSGSPLLYADDHTVAGLLFGGRKDYDHAGGFSFFRHEGAIPAAVLVAWLKAKQILPAQ